MGNLSSPKPWRYNPQQDTGTRHRLGNNMRLRLGNNSRLSSSITLRALSSLLALTISLGGVVTTLDDEVLGLVVVLAAEVGLEQRLCAGGVALLGVDGGAGHVGHGGVAAAPGAVGGGAERVLLGCGLDVPDVTTVTAELAGLEGLGDIFLDDDGATGGVDEP